MRNVGIGCTGGFWNIWDNKCEGNSHPGNCNNKPTTTPATVTSGETVIKDKHNWCK